MNHITDLRLADFPTLVLLLAGDVVVHITAPTLDLVAEVDRSRITLESILSGAKNEQKQKTIYDLAAQLINCNEDDFKTTGFELLTKYKWSLRAVHKFFEDYQAFIESIKQEKN